ncbi:hypothetical protein DFH09DRAFT_1323652 [Mycena vulgaris]|nr:hypothetical protein DFH09DRAFT_1323652 [Mycena vulgaris]
MFTNICLTLALGVSAAQSLSVNAPSSVTSGGQTTMTWSSTSSDATFSIELIHPSFNNAFAIANSVDPTTNTLTLTIPPVPAEDGYSLQFVNVSDINQVYATSWSFAIGAEASASSTSTSTASFNSAASATAGAGGSASANGMASTTGGTGAAGNGSGSVKPTSSAARAGTLPAVAAAIVALIGAAATARLEEWQKTVLPRTLRISSILAVAPLFSTAVAPRSPDVRPVLCSATQDLVISISGELHCCSSNFERASTVLSPQHARNLDLWYSSASRGAEHIQPTCLPRDPQGLRPLCTHVPENSESFLTVRRQRASKSAKIDWNTSSSVARILRKNSAYHACFPIVRQALFASSPVLETHGHGDTPEATTLLKSRPILRHQDVDPYPGIKHATASGVPHRGTPGSHSRLSPIPPIAQDEAVRAGPIGEPHCTAALGCADEQACHSRSRTHSPYVSAVDARGHD